MMPETNRSQRGGYWLAIAMVILAAILGGLFLKKYAGRGPLPQAPQQAAPEEGVRTATLFFATPDGSGLSRESREIGPCSDTAECAEEVLGELINGPLGDLSPTLPETAMYHEVTLSGDLLTVDFGKELQDGLVAGSNAEMSAVYSVINSMAVNFAQVQRVRFFVEGSPVETLKGHLDLREPLAPDYTLEKRSSAPEAAPTPERGKR